MLKNLAPLAAIASLVLASTAAHAETRPSPTTFAITVNDDYFEEEPAGWLWAGIGILAGLGILVLIGGKGNSPR